MRFYLGGALQRGVTTTWTGSIADVNIFLQVLVRASRCPILDIVTLHFHSLCQVLTAEQLGVSKLAACYALPGGSVLSIFSGSAATVHRDQVLIAELSCTRGTPRAACLHRKICCSLAARCEDFRVLAPRFSRGACLMDADTSGLNPKTCSPKLSSL